jgi:hypothetical protein
MPGNRRIRYARHMPGSSRELWAIAIALELEGMPTAQWSSGIATIVENAPLPLCAPLLKPESLRGS